MSWLLRRGGLYEIQYPRLRRILDFQFESIWIEVFKRVHVLARTQITVLDFGSGRAPFRCFFQHDCRYLTVDPFEKSDYSNLSEIPHELKADLILLVETLEHVRAPEELLQKLKNHLHPIGQLWLSVPFNARVHGAPDDYQRWTSSGLTLLLQKAGWRVIECHPRGSDWTTLISKWIFFWSRRLFSPFWFFPSALILLTSGIPVLLLGHISLWLKLGNPDDPLGWFVIASPVS